ncbi:MAG: phosphatase PAP2 family protein [Candidatus Izemoplasma sp.]|nr:phosphatase PAP2 family protein [Candidatus Izemoplasma sp.]
MTIEAVEFIQQFRTPFFDLFFNFISFLGEETMYMLVLAIVYFGIDKTKGEFLAFMLFTAGFLNGLLKGSIGAQRPFEKYPDRVTNLRPQTTGGSSFPSGHTQHFTTFLMGGALLLKQKKYIAIAIGMGLLMGLSRLYLGVHFLEDVLTSVVLGVITAYIGFYIFFTFYRYRLHMYLAGSIIALLVLFVIDSHYYVSGISLFIGFTLAMIFEHKLVNVRFDPKLSHRITRVVVGLIVLGATQALFSAITDNVYVEALFNVFLVFIGFGLYPMMIKLMQDRKQVKNPRK